MTRTVRRTVRSSVAALAVVAVLTGCSSLPWAEPTPTPSTPTPSASPAQPIPNDLSSGSTARTLTAGALTVDINYWSTLTMDKWTSGAAKPVSLSLITTITPNDGQKVYLQKATMTATPGSFTDQFDPLPAQVDQATTNPGYLVLDPYSYSQTFNVGPVPDGATFVTLQFTYDFLVQTTPTSSEYAKQTASETVTVAIAQQ